MQQYSFRAQDPRETYGYSVRLPWHKRINWWTVERAVYGFIMALFAGSFCFVIAI